MVLSHNWFNSRSKLRQADIEGAAESHDGVERRRLVAELEERYVGAVKPRVEREGFLRLVFASSQLADSLSKCLVMRRHSGLS